MEAPLSLKPRTSCLQNDEKIHSTCGCLITCKAEPFFPEAGLGVPGKWKGHPSRGSVRKSSPRAEALKPIEPAGLAYVSPGSGLANRKE